MSTVLARVTCPSCSQTFNAPLDRVLDVEVDPAARSRLLSGWVNVAICPHCGAGGAVNLPFLYHDPSKELALVHMPMEAVRSDQERQQVIGSLSREVMNQLPPEQRKGYLLSPEVFLSQENLIKRVLEAEGITEEMIDAQRAKADLLRELLEASSAEERMGIVEENESKLDEEFFRILQTNVRQAEAMGQEEVVQTFADLRTLLFEETATGRRLAARSETLEAFEDQPTRERLLELLVEAQDEDTRTVLLSYGLQLVDYFFFQSLTQRIEAAEDEGERKRLEDLRKEVMTFREQFKERAQQVVAERAQLVHDLMTSEQPKLLARRRAASLDETFFAVLSSEIERAEAEGDTEMLSRLQEVWQLVMELVQKMMPPGVALMGQVLEAEDEKEVRQVLEKNRQQVDGRFVELLEGAAEELREQGATDVADRAVAALAVARTMVPSGGEEGLVTPQ
ncbi:MAG: CpXC domain-containing protein [Anaerolineae bacterium]|jgi:hypothetical protein